MTEDTIVPTRMDCEAVELDIVLQDVLIVMHLQVVDSVFGVSGGIYGYKLSMEGADEC